MRKPISCLLVLLITACESPDTHPETPVLALTPLQTWLFSHGPWGNAGAAIIDSTGAAVVGYSADGVILSLDPSGEVAWRYGRRGGGPGEFMSIGSISVAGDTLYVADNVQQRMTAVSSRGDFIGTSAARIPGFGGFHRLEGGDLAFTAYPPAASPEWSEGIPLVRLDVDGDVADTLEVHRLETFQISVADGANVYFVGQPLSKDPIVRVSPLGNLIAVVDRNLDDDEEEEEDGGSLARVTWIDTAGDTMATQRVPFPPVHLSQSTRDSLRSQIESALPRRRSVQEAAARQAYLPDVLPPVTRALIGGRGEVWLRGADSGEDSVRWVVVTPDSGAVGALRLAETSRVLASHGCYLLVSDQNALGVESLSLGTICRGADAPPGGRDGESL